MRAFTRCVTTADAAYATRVRWSAIPQSRRADVTRRSGRPATLAMLVCGLLVTAAGTCGLLLADRSGHGALPADRTEASAPDRTLAALPHASSRRETPRPVDLIIPAIGDRKSTRLNSSHPS